MKREPKVRTTSSPWPTSATSPKTRRTHTPMYSSTRLVLMSSLTGTAMTLTRSQWSIKPVEGLTFRLWTNLKRSATSGSRRGEISTACISGTMMIMPLRSLGLESIMNEASKRQRRNLVRPLPRLLRKARLIF